MDNNKLKEKVLMLLCNIGDIIKSTRDSKKIKISDLSKLSGVSPSVISDLENHKGVMPSIYTLISIANALELPEETFLELIWSNINKKITFDNLPKLEKLKSVLTDYGLPVSCMNRVIDYIDYYVALDQIENNYKVINLIYESELSNGTQYDNIMLDPTLIMETKKNIERIEKIKAGLN